MGENFESREASLPSTEIPDLFQHEDLVEKQLASKYRTGQPQQVARTDAILVATAKIASAIYGAAINPNADNVALEESAADEWKKAITDSKSDNWKTMKELLQREARSGLAISSKAGLLSRKADFQKEDIAAAHANLAKSL